MLAPRIVPIVCSGSFVMLALLACGPQVELETDSTDGSGSGSTTEPTTTVGPGTDPTLDTGTDDGPPVPTERAVDILFVIDNSGSMGEEQATLSSSIAALFEVLEDPDAPIDYRIGVTTTDNGNPWCGTTGPEAGNLRLTSCRSRPTEFTFDGAVVIDAFDEACAAACPEEWTNIEIQPTAVEGQNGAAVRPWIERIAGQTNLPAGLSTAQAFACIAPQGIDGCGFESHLESMYKAILRSHDENEDEYGFHREGALLAIMFMTDEIDCSYSNEWESIFLPDGDRVFWSDPVASSPTSAVCWNAGVACNADHCFAVNLDVTGNEVSEAQADTEAVLRPVSRYTAQLAEQGAYVFAIDGVGLDGVPVYQPSLMDPQFQNDFGIGPGCESPVGRAVPPVREHELIETISGSGNEASVCAPDYSPALSAFAQGIVDRLP